MFETYQYLQCFDYDQGINACETLHRSQYSHSIFYKLVYFAIFIDFEVSLLDYEYGIVACETLGHPQSSSILSLNLGYFQTFQYSQLTKLQLYYFRFSILNSYNQVI